MPYNTCHERGLDGRNWIKVGVKNWLRISGYFSHQKLQLGSYPTKSQSDYMYGIYSRRSVCLSCKVHLSIYPHACLHISLPFSSTLGGGDAKGVLHHSSTKPCTSPIFTCYTRVYYIYSRAGVLTHNTSLVYMECGTPHHDWRYIYVLAPYLFPG